MYICVYIYIKSGLIFFPNVFIPIACIIPLDIYLYYPIWGSRTPFSGSSFS